MSDAAENETPSTESQEAQAPIDPVERIAALEAEVAKAKDDMLRALADAENTRRRSEKAAVDARAYAIDRFARDLLPIADTLQRAIAAITPESRASADEATKTLFEGVEMTERALIEAFSRHGLRRIGVAGEKFDPNLHQAVAQIPSDAPANHVAEVLQPGFVLADRTLRAAMVIISLGPSATAPNTEAGGGVDIKV